MIKINDVVTIRSRNKDGEETRAAVITRVTTNNDKTITITYNPYYIDGLLPTGSGSLTITEDGIPTKPYGWQEVSVIGNVGHNQDTHWGECRHRQYGAMYKHPSYDLLH